MKQFDKIYIEISDYCSLKCSFCPSATLKNKKGIMPLALFESICKQIQKKVKRVCLHILGDPLSVSNFEDYAKILHDNNLKVDLVTTGLFLEKRHFEILLSKPFVQISFSLSAFLHNPTLLKKSHLYNILAFCEAHKECRAYNFINLRFHYNDTLKNSIHFREMLEIIKRYFAFESIDITKGRIRLCEKILLMPTPSFEWESSTQSGIISKDSKPLCYGASKQFGILSNAEIVPCCIDYAGRAAFGNAREQKIAQIIESAPFIHFAKMLAKGIAPCDMCQKCGYKMILN